MASSIKHIITNFLCTSTASSSLEPIVGNAGELTLPTRGISIILVEAPTELNTNHLYQLNAIADLLSGIASLAVDHRIDHMYSYLLKISLLNMEHDTIHISRKTFIGKLQSIDIKNIEDSNILWTTDGTVDTTNSQQDYQVCHLNQSSSKNTRLQSTQ